MQSPRVAPGMPRWSQSLTLSYSEEPGRGPATPGKCGLFELLKLNAGDGLNKARRDQRSRRARSFAMWWFWIGLITRSAARPGRQSHAWCCKPRRRGQCSKTPESSQAVQFPVPFSLSLSLWSTPRRLYGPQPTCGANRKELTQIDGNPVNSGPGRGSDALPQRFDAGQGDAAAGGLNRERAAGRPRPTARRPMRRHGSTARPRRH